MREEAFHPQRFEKMIVGTVRTAQKYGLFRQQAGVDGGLRLSPTIGGRTLRPVARRRGGPARIQPRHGTWSTPEHNAAPVPFSRPTIALPGRNTFGPGPDDPSRGEPS